MAKIPPNQASTAPAWTGSVRTIFLFALAASLVLVVVLSTAALPLAIGGVLLAYLLYPLKSFLQRQVFRGRSGPAVALVLLLVLGVLFALVLIIVPTVLQQTVTFFESTLPAIGRFLTEPLLFNGEPLLNDSGEPFIIVEQLRTQSERFLSREVTTVIDDLLEQTTASSALSIGEQVLNVLGDVTLNVVNISFRVFGTITAFALNTLFMMLLLSYFLSDGQTMIENIIEAAPDGFERDLRRLFWELGRVWNDYLRGQLILGTTIAIVMWLISFILGLQGPLFLGIFAGFMEFIPNIGAALSIIPPILVAVISGSSRFPEMNVFLLVGILLGLWIAVQQVQGLFIQPRVIGDSLNLHPVFIVFGVLVGGSLGGVVGIILASPTLATLRIIFQYVYGRLADEPPFRNNPNYELWVRQHGHSLRYEPAYLDTATPLAPVPSGEPDEAPTNEDA